MLFIPDCFSLNLQNFWQKYCLHCFLIHLLHIQNILWYQMEGSKKHQTLKRQKKGSYMRVLYNGKHEHTPITGGFCNQNPKTRVQSHSEIQRLCQVLCEEVAVSSTETRKLSWRLWGRQAGCSRILKHSIPTSAVEAQSWQKVGLIFMRHADEYRWEAKTEITINTNPHLGCLGSFCSHGVLTLSVVRELDTWLSKELFSYVCSGTFL